MIIYSTFFFAFYLIFDKVWDGVDKVINPMHSVQYGRPWDLCLADEFYPKQVYSTSGKTEFWLSNFTSLCLSRGKEGICCGQLDPYQHCFTHVEGLCSQVGRALAFLFSIEHCCSCLLVGWVTAQMVCQWLDPCSPQLFWKRPWRKTHCVVGFTSQRQ